MRLGTDIDALVFSALGEFFKRNGVVVVGVVLNAFFMGVAAVVEEDAATGDTVVGPVMDGASGGGVGADDVGAAGVVVEGLAGEMGKLNIGYGELAMDSLTFFLK